MKLEEKIQLSLIDYSINIFKDYHDDMEKKFSDDIDKLNSKSLSDTIWSDQPTIETDYIKIHRNSMVVSIYSFLETSLHELCVFLYNQKNYPIETKELAGNGIQREKKYLEKFAGVDFTRLNSSWEKLIILSTIRNCLVHCDGRIYFSNNEVKLKKIIEQQAHLSLSQDKYLHCKKEFINDQIDAVTQFIHGLYAQI